MFLVRAIGIGPHFAGDFGPPEIGRQIAAAVRRAEFQAGEAVECSVEHHAREENRGFQGIPDDIAQVASSLERIFLEDILGALRVHENHDAEFLRLGPERIVLRQGNVFPQDVPADGGAARPQFLDGVFELLGRQVGKLQRDRADSAT